MNKTKKGLLTANSILTIIGCAFQILISLVLFLAGGLVSEQMMKDSYLEDPEYSYYENLDGSYYFTTIDDNVEITITEDEIEVLSKVISIVVYVLGGVMLAQSIAKLVLAIRILVINNQNKYAKGSVIALLVLSIIDTNIIQIILLILAMCQKDEYKIEDNSYDAISGTIE